MLTDGSQWFAIFNAGTGDLVSTGNVVTFPLGTGLRAVTVDGPQNGRYWDKTTLNFLTNPLPPPPPPPPLPDPFPFLRDGGDAPLIFKNGRQTSAVITFAVPFTEIPRVTGLVVATTDVAKAGSFMDLQVGSLSKTRMIVYGRSDVSLNYTQRITWSVEQRWKDKA